jgi:ABC-type Fe3+-hydroxamate transport system substrate-binding protein
MSSEASTTTSDASSKLNARTNSRTNSRDVLEDVLDDLEPAAAGASTRRRKARVGYLQQMIGFAVVVGLLWLLFGQGSPLAKQTEPTIAPVVETPRPWVATTSPAISDTLWQLGLIAHVVGRSPYCARVPKAVPVIGDLRDFDAERLALAKPDVLFVQPPLAGVDPALRSFCEKNGIRVVEQRLDSFAETRALVDQIARTFATEAKSGGDGLAGRLADAEKLFAEFEAATAQSAPATDPTDAQQNTATRARPKVLCLVSADPFLAVGHDNYLHELLAAEGFENALDREGWIEIAPEAIVALNIDAVLAIAESARGAERMRAAISQLPWTGASPVSAVVEAPQLLAPSLMALADRGRLRASYERAIAESKR